MHLNWIKKHSGAIKNSTGNYCDLVANTQLGAYH